MQNRFILIISISLVLQVAFINCGEQRFEIDPTIDGAFESHSLDQVDDGDDKKNNDDPSDQPQGQNPVEPDNTDDANNDNGDDDNGGLPPPPTGDVGPAFFAVGFWQSTMFSCDGGKTWEGYQSLDDDFRCNSASHGNVDCFHSVNTPRGAVWDGEGIVVGFGDRYDGRVLKSLDGRNWTYLLKDYPGLRDIAYGNDHHFLFKKRPYLSTDGINWSEGGNVNVNVNLRKADFVPHGGGYFVAMGSSGESEMTISRDNGLTFKPPKSIPSACALGSIAYNNSVALIKSGEALCISTDDGDNWDVVSQLKGYGGGDILFNGQEFRIYYGNRFHSSTDGIVWKLRNIEMASGDGPPSIEQVTYHPDLKSYVGVSGKYENTEYYYSADGVTWSRTKKEGGAAPLAPHPIRRIIAGHLQGCSK